MSSTVYDNLRLVESGRTDWKIIVRIIRKWVVVTITGEVFKGFNLLLLDGKKCRMHASVPGTLSERMGKMLEDGKLYIIKNFEVKNYTVKEKYRVVDMDRKIVFTSETRIKDVDETEVFIPKNMFDLFEYGELKARGEQNVYLTDVIGLVVKKQKILHYRNSLGVDTVNVRFKITNGRKNINVTFWGSLAEEFEAEFSKFPPENNIVIIASARIKTWQEEIDLTNYNPTRFYINDDHHSVAKLRKQLQDPNYKNHRFYTRNKPPSVLFIKDIKNLGEDFKQDEVICKVNIKLVDKTTDWKVEICSSCYMETEVKDEAYHCKNCQRIVPHCLKRFKVTVIAADESGGLEIILKDREVRSIIHSTVEDLETEDKVFPKLLQTIQGKNYTVKLRITEENLKQKNSLYVASNIMLGWDYVEETFEEADTISNTQSITLEPSGSSYHIDNLSQLN